MVPLYTNANVVGGHFPTPPLRIEASNEYLNGPSPQPSFQTHRRSESGSMAMSPLPSFFGGVLVRLFRGHDKPRLMGKKWRIYFSGGMTCTLTPFTTSNLISYVSSKKNPPFKCKMLRTKLKPEVVWHHHAFAKNLRQIRSLKNPTFRSQKNPKIENPIHLQNQQPQHWKTTFLFVPKKGIFPTSNKSSILNPSIFRQNGRPRQAFLKMCSAQASWGKMTSWFSRYWCIFFASVASRYIAVPTGAVCVVG